MLKMYVSTINNNEDSIGDPYMRDLCKTVLFFHKVHRNKDYKFLCKEPYLSL